MNIADFIKLPARQAAELYREHRDAGDAPEASRLHQAYFEAHRIRLSVDRQVADATSVPRQIEGPDTAPGERSRIRRVGVVLSILGALAAAFGGAAGIGGAALAFALALSGAGFALWLVGIVEDRLIIISRAINAGTVASSRPAG